MKRLFLHNLGCAKNQVDGELLAGWASKGSVSLVENPYEADVIVVNTCAFIQEAKEEAIEAILEAAKVKAESDCQALYVCGCFPQIYRDELKAEFPEVDAFFGVHEWPKLLRTLTQNTVEPSGNPYLERHLWTPRHYAYIRIADGCDRGCTYCVIPRIRGSYRSRPPDEIIEEAKYLADQGVRELLPVAQELNSYGHDLGIGQGNEPLISLLEKLCNIEKLEWIRPLYLHPPACNEALLEFWASQPKLCRYLDLPIEHASDRILKAMGRGGHQVQIGQLIQSARRMMDDVVIRTSIIVGFPGETEADLEELLDFVRAIQFERLGSFRFSAEEYANAASLPQQVPEAAKTERQERLMLLQSEISHEINLARVGQVEEVFVDRYEESGLSIAHSRKELPELDGEILVRGRYPEGSKLRVRIESAAEHDLMAVPLRERADQTYSKASIGGT